MGPSLLSGGRVHATAVSAGTKSFTCISKIWMLRNAHGSYLDKEKVSSKSRRHMRNLCYCSSKPQRYAHYIPEPSPMSRKLNWEGNFLLMNYSFERIGLHSTSTGTVDDIDALSLIGCISVLEVFRLKRKVVCYRHSLPLLDFRQLVLHAKFSECWQRFAGPLKMGLRP